ncbi:MAG TPA: hypothetical protein VHL77_04085 [Ferruginibacter sp.]|nr:hypothetical protein [Ferruginibacter sp.]
MKKYITICILGCSAIITSCNIHKLVVTEKPAEPVYERPAPPSPDYIWTGPAYTIADGKYEYRGGRWVAPPTGNHRWVEGKWKETKDGWVWINGRWYSR